MLANALREHLAEFDLIVAQTDDPDALIFALSMPPPNVSMTRFNLASESRRIGPSKTNGSSNTWRGEEDGESEFWVAFRGDLRAHAGELTKERSQPCFAFSFILRTGNLVVTPAYSFAVTPRQEKTRANA
jgi:hypothetical protein